MGGTIFYSYYLLMGSYFSQLFINFVDGKALLYYVYAISVNNFQHNKQPMSANKITLGQYIDGKTIQIPCYQRGYIWGKEHVGSKNSVSYMLDTLCEGYKNSTDIFIQGITVAIEGDKYSVIDGQQRSTFFYLLLKTLGVEHPFTIEYNSSRGSTVGGGKVNPGEWLKNCNEDEEITTQDGYFFKKTICLIKKHELYTKNKNEIIKYIRQHVYFLLINISQELAVSTFTMMNGNKAIMQDYELIKADLLRMASLGTGGYTNNQASEWDNISLRSRYAHEWDRWLHWWNQEEVKLMFNCQNPMGWLLKTEFEDNKSGLFEAYKLKLKENNKAKNPAFSAKYLFSQLRDCQHKFEDVFSLPKEANCFGVIMRLLSNDQDKIGFIKAYFGYTGENDKCNVQDLKLVVDLLLIGFTYKNIVHHDFEKKDKIEEFRQTLAQNPIYGVNNELAYNYLLVRNVERDTELNRKFDFTIVAGNRSLEHVYPKSMVLHLQNNDIYRGDSEPLKYEKDFKDEDFNKQNGSLKLGEIIMEKGYISRDDIQNHWKDLVKDNSSELSLDLASVILSEHSIGNLLLLYGNNNSEFGNMLPEKKRQSYFDLSKVFFSSRHLLHTVFSFAQYQKFDESAICQNQLDVINDVEQRIKYVELIIK